MSDLQARDYPESRFGGYTDVDGTVVFYTRVQALLRPDATVVDLGCGRGAFRGDPVGLRRELRTFRGRYARVLGLDVDEAGREDPFVDEFRPIRDGPLPLDDGSVHLVISDSVLEHVEDPNLFFSECRRVLRPGGHVCIRTPNRNSYLGLASRLVPNRRDARVLASVQDGRRAEDVFPTLTRRRLRSSLSQHGFDACVYA